MLIVDLAKGFGVIGLRVEYGEFVAVQVISSSMFSIEGYQPYAPVSTQYNRRHNQPTGLATPEYIPHAKNKKIIHPTHTQNQTCTPINPPSIQITRLTSNRANKLPTRSGEPTAIATHAQFRTLIRARWFAQLHRYIGRAAACF